MDWIAGSSLYRSSPFDVITETNHTPSIFEEINLFEVLSTLFKC